MCVSTMLNLSLSFTECVLTVTGLTSSTHAKPYSWCDTMQRDSIYTQRRHNSLKTVALQL